MTIDQLILKLEEKKKQLGGHSIVYLSSEWMPEFDVTRLHQHEIEDVIVIDEGEVGLTIEQYIP